MGNLMSTILYKVTATIAFIYKNPSFFRVIVAILAKETLVEMKSISGMLAYAFYNNRKGFLQASVLEMVTSSILIKYIDKNNTEIATTKILNNLPLNTYTYSAIEIYNYDLLDETPITITLSKDNLNPTITFVYRKKPTKKGTIPLKV